MPDEREQAFFGKHRPLRSVARPHLGGGAQSGQPGSRSELRITLEVAYH